MLSMSLLIADQLSLSYGETQLFHDLSFTLERGERVGLVGPNGAGKSTLLRLIAGEIAPDSGALRIENRAAVRLLHQEAHLGGAETLSGGERTRAAISEALSGSPSLLLLDEPTNHLDLDSVRHLIQRLRDLDCAVLIVSHDRYFLDETVDRILELEEGKLTEYWGGYSDYREQKAQDFESRVHRWTESQKRRKALEEDIAAMRRRAEVAHRKSTEKPFDGLKMGKKEAARARAKKMDKKVKNDVKRLQRMIEDGEPEPEAEKNVYFRLEGEAPHGKRVLEAKDLAKRFGSRVLFENASFTLCRGDRAALYGGNGTGKTTLIRMLLGQEPYEGDLWLSPTAHPHLLEQDFAAFEGCPLSVLQFLQQELGAVGGEARTMLNNLGLSARHMNQRVSSLSFGEKMKVKLAVPMLRREDFLILDEPTNHLDLHTREQLEETLSAYNGTLIVVSHDVYLLRRLCTRVLYLNDERILPYPAPFSRFMTECLHFDKED